MKKIPVLNNISLYLLGFLIVFATASCGDDDGPAPDPLVGLYTLTSATLNDPLDFGGPAPLPAGTDLSEELSAALFAAADCQTGSNTRVELRDGGSIFLVCLGEGTNPLRNGSWEIDAARTTLTMTLPIQGFVIPVVLLNLVESGSTVSGDVNNLPIPKSLFDPSAGPAETLPINVNLAFTKD